MYKFLLSLMGGPLFDKCLVFPDKLIHGTFKYLCVKCPEVAPGYTNAQPPGCNKIANTLSRDRQREQMLRGCLGGWALLELTDALLLAQWT